MKKAKEKKFETTFCFSIGKVYKPGVVQVAPYGMQPLLCAHPRPLLTRSCLCFWAGHAVTRSEKLMKEFMEKGRGDITNTFYYALTEGRPTSMIVDLDTISCDNPKDVEAFGHRLMDVLADFAEVPKGDPIRKMYAMTTRHRNGKASVHLVHRRLHFKDPRQVTCLSQPATSFPLF